VLDGLRRAVDHVPLGSRDTSKNSIQSLIDPSLGWAIIGAAAINNRGQIAATAFTGAPHPHAVLLTPPPK
jgi:hypothetical protein